MSDRIPEVGDNDYVGRVEQSRVESVGGLDTSSRIKTPEVGDADYVPRRAAETASNFYRLLDIAGEDPEEHADKIGSAVYLAEIMGHSPEYVWQNYDYVVEQFMGRPAAPQQVTTAIANSFERMRLMTEIAELRAEQWAGNDSDELQAHIDQLKRQLPPEDQTDRHWLLQALTSGGEITAQISATSIRGLSRGALGSGAGAVIGGLAGLPFGPAAAAALAVTGAKIGGMTAVAKDSAVVMGGLFYDSILEMRDENGNAIDPRIAWYATGAVAVLGGALEAYGLTRIPGVDEILQRTLNVAVRRTMFSEAFQSAVSRSAYTWVTRTAEETGVELTQEVMNIIAEEWLKEATNYSNRTEFERYSINEIIKRVGQTALQTVVGMGVISVPGSVWAGYRAGRSARMDSDGTEVTPEVTEVTPEASAEGIDIQNRLAELEQREAAAVGRLQKDPEGAAHELIQIDREREELNRARSTVAPEGDGGPEIWEQTKSEYDQSGQAEPRYWSETPEAIRLRDQIRERITTYSDAEIDATMFLIEMSAAEMGIDPAAAIRETFGERIINTAEQQVHAELNEWAAVIQAENPGVTRQEAVERARLRLQGATVALNDGRHLIQLSTRNSNDSTLIHEYGHILRRQLSPKMQARAEAIYGVKDGYWEREQDEQFARDWEEYWRTGKAPTPELESIFERLARMMRRVYTAIVENSDLTDEKRAFFDELAINAFNAPMSESSTVDVDGDGAQPAATGEQTLFQGRDLNIPVITQPLETPITPDEALQVPTGYPQGKGSEAKRIDLNTALDAVAQKYPNPLESRETWNRFIADLTGNETTGIIFPERASRWRSNPQEMKAFLAQMTPGQKKSAKDGLKTAREIGRLLKNKELDSTDFGLVLVWASLSKQLTASVQEAGFLRALNEGVRPFVEKAASGHWSASDTAHGLKWVEENYFPGSGLPTGAKANMNQVFKTVLPSLATSTIDGEPLLPALVKRINNRGYSSAQIRRDFLLATAERSAGIRAKVFSFALLVSGRQDVVVIDRWQVRNFWNDNPELQNTPDLEIRSLSKKDGLTTNTVNALDALYDNIPIGDRDDGTTKINGMQEYLDGPLGVALYEAFERALGPATATAYGVKNSQVGRFHWESWLVINQQEVGHASLDAIKNRSPENARVVEGRKNAKFGDIFAIEDGEEVYYTHDIEGGQVRLTREQYAKLPEGNQKYYQRKLAIAAHAADERRRWTLADGYDERHAAREGRAYLRRQGIILARRQLRDKLGLEDDAKSSSTGLYRGSDRRFNRQSIAGESVSARKLTPNTSITNLLIESGSSVPDLFELDTEDTIRESAEFFHRRISDVKAAHTYGAAVHVYPVEAYESMRLFLSGNGETGFALNGDDIVSVFNVERGEHRAVTTALILEAVAQGGRRLDAFDTELPKLYSAAGMSVVARVAWNDEIAQSEMPDWDKSVFSNYNNGEPDIVMMVYDPYRTTPYDPSEGGAPMEWDDAAQKQQRQVKRLNRKLRSGEITLFQGEMDATEIAYYNYRYHGSIAAPKHIVRLDQKITEAEKDALYQAIPHDLQRIHQALHADRPFYAFINQLEDTVGRQVARRILMEAGIDGVSDNVFGRQTTTEFRPDERGDPNDRLNVDTETFRRWFDNSVIRTYSSSEQRDVPLLMHYPTTTEFAGFVLNDGGYNFYRQIGAADLVAKTKAEREGGEPLVISAYLNIRNPATFDDPGASLKTVLERGYVDRYTEQGRDGVVAYNAGVEEAIAFRPDQIMRADAVQGVDPEDYRFQASESDISDELDYRSLALVDEKVRGPLPGRQIMAMLKKSGIRDEELAWTGLDEYLATDEKRTAGDIREYLSANRLEIKEIVLTNDQTEYDDYTLPEAYTHEPRNYREILFRFPLGVPPYIGPHYVEPNVLAHARVSDRSRAALYDAVEVPRITKALLYDIKKLGFKHAADMINHALLFEGVGDPTMGTIDVKQSLGKDKSADEIAADVRKAVESDEEQFKEYESVFTDDTWPIYLRSRARGVVSKINQLLARIEFEIIAFERERDSGQTPEGVDVERILAHLRARHEYGKSVAAEWLEKAGMSRADVSADEELIYHHPDSDIYFIEEIQSDLHQGARETGYRKQGERVAEALGGQNIEVLVWHQPGKDPEVEIYHTENEISDEPHVDTFRNDAYREIYVYESFEEVDAFLRSQGLRENVVYDFRGDLQNSSAPEAPLKKNWHEFVFRRMLREAARNGYAYVGWTTGEQQSRRYGLVASTQEAGMKRFYDRVLVQYAEKIGKKFGVAPEELTLFVGDEDGGETRQSIHALPITPQMAESSHTRILFQGLELTKHGADHLVKTYGSIQDAANVVREVDEQLDLFDENSHTHAESVNAPRRGPSYGTAFGLAPDESRVKQQWRNARRVDYTGHTVRSARDVARLFQVFRNERLEHFHYIYVNEKNEIVGHNALSSGLPAMTIGVESKSSELAAWKVRQRMSRLGATRYYILHNHPSGNTAPSKPDYAVTYGIAERVPGMAGSIIIDHNRYRDIYSSDGSERYIESDAVAETPVVSEFVTVTSRGAVAAVGKEMIQAGSKTSLVVLNGRFEVAAWHPIKPGTFKPIAARQIIQRHGGVTGIVVTTENREWHSIINANRDEPEAINQTLLDVVWMSDDGWEFESAFELGLRPESYRWDYASNPWKGKNYKSYLFQGDDAVDEHEEAVRGAVESGKYVPSRVLADYTDRPWGIAEIERRKAARAEAAAFKTVDEYVEYMQQTDIDPRPDKYYRALYEEAPRRSYSEENERWVNGLTKEAVVAALMETIQQDRVDDLPHERLREIAEKVRRGEQIEDRDYKSFIRQIKRTPGEYRQLFADIASDGSTLEAILEESVYELDIVEIEKIRADRRALSEANKIGNVPIDVIEQQLGRHKEWLKEQEAGIAEAIAAVEEAEANYRELESHSGMGPVHDAKLEVQRLSLKETKRKLLQGREAIASTKQLMRALYRYRENIQRQIKRIMAPPAGTIDYVEAQEIIAIQSGLRVGSMSKKRREQFENVLNETQNESLKRMLTRELDRQDLKKMSPEELDALEDTIEGLRDLGRERRREKLEAEAYLRAQAVNSVIDEITNGKGLENIIAYGSKETNKELKRGRIPRAFLYSWRPERLWRAMGDGEGSEIYRWLWKEVNQATNDELQNTLERITDGEQKMRELGISPKRLGEILFVGDVHYTRDEVIHMYVAMQDEFSAAALQHGNRLSIGMINAFIGQLSREDRIWGDWMIDSFGMENFDRIQEVLIETENRGAEKIERYFPMLRKDYSYRDFAEEVADSILRRTWAGKAAVNKKFTLSRVKISPRNQRPIRLGATAIWRDQIAKQEKYIANARTIQRLRSIFERRETIQALVQEYGESAVSVIQQYINDVTNPSIFKAQDGMSRTMQILRNHYAVGVLAYNAKTVLKQLPSSILYMAEVGPYRYIASWAKFLANPVEAVRFVEARDPQVKARTMNRFMEEIRLADKNRYEKIVSKVGTTGFLGIAAADKMAVSIGWRAVYDKYVTELGEAGAIEKAQLATLRTQPAGRAKDLAAMYRTDKGLAWFLMFSNQLNQIWNLTTYDLYDDVKRGKAAAAFGIVFGVAMNALAMGVISRMRLWDADAEPEERAQTAGKDILFQLLSAVPAIGGNVVSGIQGWSFGSGVDPFPWAYEVGALSRQLADGEIDNSDFEAMIKLLEAAGIAAGLPSVAAARVRRAFLDDDLNLDGFDPWELIGGRPEE